jgi:hypothetical protein
VALAYMLRGIGLWSGRGLDAGHAQLMESDSVFQMSQYGIIPVIAFGTPFKVEIPSC